MKKIIFAVVLGVASITALHSEAQVSANINIGQHPTWWSSGYNHVDYYYLPDVGAYYDVPAKQFIYLLNDTWHFYGITLSFLFKLFSHQEGS